jgi:hypothetical protein
VPPSSKFNLNVERVLNPDVVPSPRDLERRQKEKGEKRAAFSTSPFSHNSERSGKGLDLDSPSSDTYGNRRTCSNHGDHTSTRLKPNPRSKSPTRQQA